MRVHRIGIAGLAAVLCLAAQNKGDHWVATWGTAQNLVRTPPPRAAAPATTTAPSTPPAATTATTTAATTAATTPAAQTPQQAIGSRGFSNQTVRMIVRSSIGGRRIRVKLSNAFAGTAVKLGAAHVALRAKDSQIVPGSDRALTFGGNAGATIGPGVVLLSDPVDFNVPQFGDVAVSLYFPGETGPPTTHATGLHTTYISQDDATAKESMPDAITTQSYYFLSAIDVMAPAEAALIVTFGDSITDGARSTPNTDHSWPTLLAGRLAAKKETARFGVANMGIGGNRVLRDGAGASALARFDRDVLSQSGVKWVMLLEGINDIGRLATMPEEGASAEELIAAYKQMIERAHTHGVQVIGCTLTPYEGAGYFRENGEAVRSSVNNWIRTSGAFDAVVDFEAATRDTANPKRFKAEYDPGDHLHPNDAGYQAMADAIDLGVFTGKHSSKNGRK